MNINKPYLMTRAPLARSIQMVTIGLACFSIMAFMVNYFIYGFPGNNYFFYTPIINLALLLLSFLVLSHQLGLTIVSKEAAVEYCVYIIFVMILTFSSNAIQYTPFTPIDHYIIAFEQWLHLDGSTYMSWLYHQGTLQQSFDYIYQIIGLELLAFPIAAILLKQYAYLYEYYFLMLVAALLGYLFYYFFPTTGPASMFHLPYFSEEQLATGLKFREIHQYQQPSTMAGGMIAMPSFHVIWSCLIAYCLRFEPIACAIIAGINTLIIASCVLLGWHYLLDIVGGFLTVMLAIWIKKLISMPHSCEL